MNTIHLITAWSARREDETPICGADPYDGGHPNRTVYPDFVTCSACLAKLQRDEMDDPHDGEVRTGKYQW